MIAMSNAEGGVHEQPTSKGAIRAPLGNAVIWQDKGRAEEGYMRCVYATRGLQRAGWRPWYLADGRSCPGIAWYPPYGCIVTIWTSGCAQQ